MHRMKFQSPAYSEGDLDKLNQEQLQQMSDQFIEEDDEMKNIQLYNSLLEEDPKNLSWYHLRGISKAVLEDYDGAIDDLQVVVENDPENKNAHYNIGLVYFEQNLFQQAIFHFEKSRASDPEDASTIFAIGLCHLNQKELKLAIEYFDSAISLMPKFTEAIFSRGLAKEQVVEKTKRKRGFKFTKDHFASVLEDYTKVMEIQSDFLPAHIGLARVYEKICDFGQALKHLSKILELHSNSIEILIWRARIKLELSEFQGVIEDCNDAIAIDPSCAKAYLYRKRAYEGLGRTSEAMKDQDIIHSLLVRKSE